MLCSRFFLPQQRDAAIVLQAAAIGVPQMFQRRWAHHRAVLLAMLKESIQKGDLQASLGAQLLQTLPVRTHSLEGEGDTRDACMQQTWAGLGSSAFYQQATSVE